MDGWVVVVTVAALAVLALGGLAFHQRQRSERLRSTFGPEYEREVEGRGDRRAAERALEPRVERRQHIDVRPLSRASGIRYAAEWRQIETQFVDDPGEAVLAADRLVVRVMRERGYPVDDFEERIDLVSVDHPAVVDRYRKGYELFRRHRDGRGSTEDLREAMLNYRALFRQLVATDEQAGERIGGRR